MDHGQFVFDLDLIGLQTDTDANDIGAAFHRHRSIPFHLPSLLFRVFSMAVDDETMEPLP